MTIPARLESKGRLAALGSSLYEEHIAFIAQKPPKESGVIAASAPPLSITSASPFCQGLGQG
jgi:hypothetical protein